MSSPTHLKRGFAGILLAVALALVAAPAAVQAAPVNLATVSPFVVLAGSTVTNKGPSVLNGDLGVSPGTSLTGFGFPDGVVNGATHGNDAVAALAQSDLTTAYTVAAGQPVAPAANLSGTNLGNRKLSPGAYRYNAAALLSGPLTLDAEGDPSAQFVFLIGSALTAESASSVVLINGASPCNVYWQVGSSATLDTTTAFQGNLMALASISLNDGATVVGRLLAREGGVTLINNVLTRPLCATGSTPPPTGTPPGSTAPVPSSGGAGNTGGSATPARFSRVGQNRAVTVRRPRAGAPTRDGTAVVRPSPREACTSGFRATVRGQMIERVVFSLDGKAVSSRTSSPFAVSVRAAPGAHSVRARVTFKDATHARTMTLPYRACAAALLQPRSGPSTFTG